VVTAGLTLRVAKLVATPVCVTPSDHVTFHGPVPVNTAVIIAELPLQITVEPLTTEVGRGFTVIPALPVRSLACAAHFESVRAVTVYVVVTEGLTLRVAGLGATAVCVTPSDHVTFHGPVPVNTAVIVAELPLQIVLEPLTTDVGRGFTVITALPVRSLA
jgi:hypothetical protein